MIHVIILSIISIVFLFGQLGRIILGNGIQFYLLEALIGLHCIIILWQLRSNIYKLSLNRIVITAIFWLFYLLILLLVRGFGNTMPNNLKAGLYIVRIGIFAVYVWLLSKISIDRKIVHTIWAWLSIAIPIICLIQYFVIPDLRSLQQFGWDPHMYRAVGLMFDPPIVGSVLGMLFVDAVIRKSRSAMLLNILAIIFLYSRSTYLAVSLCIFVYFVIKHKYLLALAWIGLFVIAIYLAPMTIPRYMVIESAKIARISTVMSRQVELKAGLQAWLSYPIFGIGYNRVSEYKRATPQIYSKESPSNHSSSAFHSFWLTMLASTGIIGFGMLIYWLYSVLRLYPKAIYIFAIPATIGLIDNVMFHPFVLVLFVIFYLKEKAKIGNSKQEQ